MIPADGHGRFRYDERMHPISLLAIAAFVALALACVNGAWSGSSFSESFGAVVDNPWGLTMLVDLNAAFLFAIGIIWLLEPRRGVAVVVTVLTPVLGSFVPLAWLIARGPAVRRRLAVSQP